MGSAQLAIKVSRDEDMFATSHPLIVSNDVEVIDSHDIEHLAVSPSNLSGRSVIFNSQTAYLKWDGYSPSIASHSAPWPLLSYQGKEASLKLKNLFRARSQISNKDSIIKVAIQVQLNVNFNYEYENLAVMASFDSLTDFANVRSKPLGVFNPSTKVMTWSCGKQQASRQASIVLEVLLDSTKVLDEGGVLLLPNFIPVIVTASVTNGLISNSNFVLKPAIAAFQEKISDTDLVVTCNEKIDLNTKLNYRFV